MLVLLVASVAVPTACVLWFMSAAVQNVRLAVRQMLVEDYEPRLTAAADEVEKHWQGKLAALMDVPADEPAAVTFALLVTSGACDSAVVYDQSGDAAYPTAAPSPEQRTREESNEWAEARRIEYALAQPADAAGAYAELAERTDDANLMAQALLARARCLAKADETDEAVEALTSLFSEERFAQTVDRRGRLVAPLAALRALELSREESNPQHEALLSGLVDRLNDYAGPLMPSSQRRFLMRRVRETAGDSVSFPTLDAEELAAAYLARKPSFPEPSRVLPSALPGVWHFATDNGSLVALFREESFLDAMGSLAQSGASIPGTRVELLQPGEKAQDEVAFLTVPLGELLPGWSLALHLAGPDPFSEAAEREVAGYLWASLLSIGAVVVMALMAGRYLLRQMRLTRLKNDFIATVTHELKTPLSSVRLFAETLREGRYQDDRQEKRYLDLLVKENERLSRLIDNFLSFSRMERDKRAFDLVEVAPEDVVQAAQGAVGERFESEGCRLDVEVEPALPHVMADPDALVTVLLNLLDNAHKYTGQEKHIALRAYAADAQVCLEVKDNGVGMSRRAVRKAFDRFYQADTSLSRGAGGCGLGLSIVKFIVDAHGGTIDIESEPGKGSTFTVRLPAARSVASGEGS